MIQKSRFDAEAWLLMQTAFERALNGRCCGLESIPAVMSAAQNMAFTDFMDFQIQRIAMVVNQIPGVGSQFAGDIVTEARWTVEMQRLVAAQLQPQQAVEPHKMIHMGVGNEDVRYFQDVTRAEGRQISQVE